MNGKIFLDTNILLYSHDSAAGIKHARARVVMDQLWSMRQGVLSTQVLQEFAVNLQRRISPPLSARETREWIAQYMQWEVATNPSSSILTAFQLTDRYT